MTCKSNQLRRNTCPRRTLNTLSVLCQLVQPHQVSKHIQETQVDMEYMMSFLPLLLFQNPRCMQHRWVVLIVMLFRLDKESPFQFLSDNMNLQGILLDSLILQGNNIQRYIGLLSLNPNNNSLSDILFLVLILLGNTIH